MRRSVDRHSGPQTIRGALDGLDDLCRGLAARVHDVRGAQLARQVQPRGQAVEADDAAAPGVLGGHDGGQADAAEANDGDTVVGPGLGHVLHGAGACLQAAAQGRQEAELVGLQVERRHVDDALGRHDRVPRERRLPKEAPANVGVAGGGGVHGRLDVLRCEDWLAHEVDVEEVGAM